MPRVRTLLCVTMCFVGIIAMYHYYAGVFLDTFNMDKSFYASDLFCNPLKVHEFDKTTNGGDVKKVKKILLVGHFRGGTSFLASLFNLPHVGESPYYIFEPLVFLEIGKEVSRKSAHAPVNTQLQYLREVFNCRYRPLIIKGELSATTRVLKMLWSVHIQDTFGIRSAEDVKHYPDAIIERLSLCRLKAIRIMKIIRVQALSRLVSMAKEEGFKLVYVVRDPRGIFSSRQHLALAEDRPFLYKDKLDLLKQDCQTMITNYKKVASLLKQNRQLQHVLQFVRYEDAARFPVAMAKALFNFTGLEYDEILDAKIAAKTKAKRLPKVKHDLQLFYHTVRLNSWRTAMQWTQNITFDAVDRIQKLAPCRKAIQLFSYGLVTDAKQLRRHNLSTCRR